MPLHNGSCLISLFYGIIVILVMTCIFTRGFTNIRTNLIDQLSSFDYPRTYVELYIIILIDSTAFILSSFIFLFKYCQHFKYLRSIRLICILTQLLIYAYSSSKFLVFYEWKLVRSKSPSYQLDRFDFLAIGFIPFFALAGIFIWILVFRNVNTKRTNTRTDPEREHLISTSTRQLYTEETNPLIVNGNHILSINSCSF